MKKERVTVIRKAPDRIKKLVEQLNRALENNDILSVQIIATRIENAGFVIEETKE